jgi:hypothetical protein
MERRFFLGLLSAIPGFNLLIASKTNAELEPPEALEPDIEDDEPPEPTHTDLGQFLWDVHQWCVKHPGATCLASDVPEWRFIGYSAFVSEGGEEQSYNATIHLEDVKTTLPRLFRPAMQKRLKQLIMTSGGRSMLGSLLATSNGWYDLVGPYDLSTEMASVTWDTRYLELPKHG